MVVINYLLIFILSGGWLVSIINFHPGKEVHILLILAMVTLSGISNRRGKPAKTDKLEIDPA